MLWFALQIALRWSLYIGCVQRRRCRALGFEVPELNERVTFRTALKVDRRTDLDECSGMGVGVEVWRGCEMHTSFHGGHEMPLELELELELGWS